MHVHQIFETYILAINSSRVEWRDASNTFFNDQFKVDMWRPSQYGPGVQVLLRLHCTIMACEVNGFLNADKNSMCQIHQSSGKTRYDNLINYRKSRSTRFSTKKIISGNAKTRSQRSEISEETVQIIFNSSVECTTFSLFMLIFALLY